MLPKQEFTRKLEEKINAYLEKQFPDNSEEKRHETNFVEYLEAICWSLNEVGTKFDGKNVFVDQRHTRLNFQKVISKMGANVFINGDREGNDNYADIYLSLGMNEYGFYDYGHSKGYNNLIRLFEHVLIKDSILIDLSARSWWHKDKPLFDNDILNRMGYEVLYNSKFIADMYKTPRLTKKQRSNVISNWRDPDSEDFKKTYMRHYTNNLTILRKTTDAEKVGDLSDPNPNINLGALLFLQDLKNGGASKNELLLFAETYIKK